MGDLESLKNLLRSLRDRKLNEATFEEKLDVKVFPSEDVKSMKVTCRLDLLTFTDNKKHYARNTT